MYTNRQYAATVRDSAPPYGYGAVPSEDFPGAGALHDLPGAEATEVPLIMARYVALRAWALRSERAPAAVVAHALSAAAEHLAAADVEWSERALLREALSARDGRRARTLLRAAATAAAGRGHPHGARALREAVHRELLWSGCFPPPSRS